MTSLCKSAIASGLGTSIYGVIVFLGCSIQEMGGNVVISCSIYGVVVIDGSLCSRFFGMATRTG